MSYINASVTDQVLKITSAPPLSSGGVNETHVEFTFCEKWEGFEKTALFYREEGKYYYSILDENNVCIVPWEVYSTAGTFYFSVFGIKDGVRRTANTVKYKVTKGLPEEGAIPSDPTPEVYEQLVAMVTKAVDVAEDMENKRDSGYFKGEKGDAPVRSVDYWTEADKDEIVRETETAMIGDTEAALDGIIAIQKDLMEGVEIDLRIEIDETLTQRGMAADAKAVGERIAEIQANRGGGVNAQKYTLPARAVPCGSGTLVFAEATDEYGYYVGNAVYVFLVDDMGCVAAYKIAGDLSLWVDADWDYGHGIHIDSSESELYTISIKAWY